MPRAYYNCNSPVDYSEHRDSGGRMALNELMKNGENGILFHLCRESVCFGQETHMRTHFRINHAVEALSQKCTILIHFLLSRYYYLKCKRQLKWETIFDDNTCRQPTEEIAAGQLRKKCSFTVSFTFSTVLHLVHRSSITSSACYERN